MEQKLGIKICCWLDFMLLITPHMLMTDKKGDSLIPNGKPFTQTSMALNRRLMCGTSEKNKIAWFFVMWIGGKVDQERHWKKLSRLKRDLIVNNNSEILVFNQAKWRCTIHVANLTKRDKALLSKTRMLPKIISPQRERHYSCWISHFKVHIHHITKESKLNLV